MKYGFIARHRRQYHLSAMCRVLHVSRSGFYEWQGRKPSARTIANRQLIGDICRVHEQSRQAYGAVKTWVALNQAQAIGVRFAINPQTKLLRHNIYRQ